MIEAGVLLFKGPNGEQYHWHQPPGRNSTYLPDTQDLWSVFWQYRDAVIGFAHTHPGRGTPSPSHTDITTFHAVESGLGQRLLWWIFSLDRGIVLLRPKDTDTEFHGYPFTLDLPWIQQLRRLSYL